MTTMRHVNCTCYVCGNVSRQTVLGSSNSFGAPDLDLRPAPMMRDTMGLWIQKCPRCGYIAKTLDTPTSVDLDFLASEYYITAGGLDTTSLLVKDFFRSYLIALEEGNEARAFNHLLHAAWKCDDSKETTNAVILRKLAIPHLETMITRETDRDRKETLLVQKMDLLRRSWQYERLICEYEDCSFSSPLLEKIRDFQIKRSRLYDSLCYRVDDVEKT